MYKNRVTGATDQEMVKETKQVAKDLCIRYVSLCGDGRGRAGTTGKTEVNLAATFHYYIGGT